METIIQKVYKKFFGYFLIGCIFLIPSLSLADGINGQCSSNGYTIATINGVFTDEKGAQGNMFALQDIFGLDWHGQSVDFQYLLNPSHIAGLGDLAMSAYQKVFDNETVKDYDLVEMLKDVSAKVKTQKLLLVAHSQGNFYANSFYDTVAGKEGGVPTESIGVYAVATPAGRVAGGGKWLTSDTDKIIANWVSWVPFKKIMAPNTNIVLAEGDDSKGHNFSGVYLKYRGSDIVSAIQSSLDKLQTNNIQSDSPCLAPPKLTLAYKAEGAILSVIDPVANSEKGSIVFAASGAYQAGNALAKSAYSLASFIAGAAASAVSPQEHFHFSNRFAQEKLVAGDNKNTNNEAVALNAINSENISSLPTESSPPSRGVLDGTEGDSAPVILRQDLGITENLDQNKIKLAEESLNNIQNQILVLQNKKAASSESNSISSLPGSLAGLLAIEASQSKFIASTYPGFGGGGDGAVSASSADLSSSSSSVDSSSSAGSSSSSLSSLSSSVSSASSSNLPDSSASSSLSSSSSIPDITPPIISSFSIAECQNSLSSDGCLVATTTLNISWGSSSADLDYFIINNNGTVSTTTATSTTIVVSDNAIFSFSVSAKDLTGNESASSAQTAEVSTMPVVINEIAWAGNGAAYSADEWIELYNRTGKTINLSNWILYSKTDLTPYINLSGAIASKGYYLLERTSDDTVSGIAADKIYTGDLVNAGENIVLVYKPASQATTTIDQIPYCHNWCGGLSNYYSMERYDPNIAGTDATNWGTNNAVIRNGKNSGGGSINGTPKARNSVNYLINKGQNISSDLTLYASGSPYLVNNTVQTFSASSTLAIEPGVVIKFYNDAGLSFLNGAKISAIGTSANPIIFTSLYDDAYGGDTNGDAAYASPSAGNWYGVRFNSPGSQSTISHAIFRYGGKYYNGPWSDSRANLYIANSSASISDSVFEYSKVYGLKMVYSDSSVTDSIFRNNNNVLDNSGYDSSLLAIGGSPSLARNSFTSNHKGAYFFNSPATLDSNVFTSNANEAIYSYGQLGSYSNNSGSGNGVDAISLSGTIAQNIATTTLSANSLPYLLRGNVIVAASSTLAVNSGITIKGWNVVSTSYLSIYGNLIASGTNFSDIVFDSMFGSPAKGNWGGLRLYSGSYSDIVGVTFEYANTAVTYENSPVNLSNVKFNENNLGVSADTASLVYPINALDIIFTSNTATTSPSGLW